MKDTNSLNRDGEKKIEVPVDYRDGKFWVEIQGLIDSVERDIKQTEDQGHKYVLGAIASTLKTIKKQTVDGIIKQEQNERQN